MRVLDNGDARRQGQATIRSEIHNAAAVAATGQLQALVLPFRYGRCTHCLARQQSDKQGESSHDRSVARFDPLEQGDRPAGAWVMMSACHYLHYCLSYSRGS